jgi:hypothetical protein
MVTLEEFEKMVEEARKLWNLPSSQLTEKEYFLAVTALFLDDAKNGVETINYRDWFLFRDFRLFVRKYGDLIDQLFRRYGYSRFGYYCWKRIDLSKLKPFNLRAREIKELLNANEDDLYVIYCAYKLLQESYLGIKDWKGFNRIDTLSIYNALRKDNIVVDTINLINKMLLKYEDQLTALGLDYNRLFERWKRVELARKYPFGVE